MQKSEYDIIILKPTSVFSHFLKAQLPPSTRIDSRILQCDNTAYIIKKQTNDEEVINEIERHFSIMFKHEINRWLGDASSNAIETSFLDFLFCFQFELHSQIVLMEQDIQGVENVLRLKPKEEILGWIKETVKADDDLINMLDTINVKHLAENSTVVVKNFEDLASIKPFLQKHYPVIAETEMLRMCEEKDSWPEINSYQDFCNYFSVDIHTQVVHLH